MTKRAFGRREGEEQIPWLMHTCPRLLPRWSSKRLLRNKGLRLFLAGLDWSADFAAGTVHGMEVGIGLPCTNCSEQRCEIVCGELLRSESYYVSGREITLDRPSLLGARPGSMGCPFGKPVWVSLARRRLRPEAITLAPFFQPEDRAARFFLPCSARLIASIDRKSVV